MAQCLWVGCDDVTPREPVRPVIEGWIDSDGYPVVLFTSSLVPDEAGQSLADKIIRWGKVTVSDGDTTVILTGGMSDSYFPPYRYYTFDIKGVPGKTYRVEADYKDFHAEAECVMPYPTKIEAVDLEPIEGNDTLYSATLRFTAPSDCPAYYCVTVRDMNNKRRPLPAMMGCVEADKPGAVMSVPVFNPKNMLDTVPFVPQLIAGQRIEVSLKRVTREVYRFWSDYNNVVLFGGSQFVSASQSLQGNIEGGYGVWSAQASDAVMVAVD